MPRFNIDLRQKTRMSLKWTTLGYISAVALTMALNCSMVYYLVTAVAHKQTRKKKKDYPHGYPGLVGNTPLIELRSLSRATGCLILGKCEFLNPGGSSKDRIAKGIVESAQAEGTITRETTHLVEGTSGSTGISLALMAHAVGLQVKIVMPDDQAQEKRHLLEQLNAELLLVKPVSIVNDGHYVSTAKALAEQPQQEAGAQPYFVNQFENPMNQETHYRTTGPEIWVQTEGDVDAFVMGAGTGGTIAGVSRYLKEQKREVMIVLADPPGSSLWNRVTYGTCFAPQQAERRVERHRYHDSVVEGVGLDRLTTNFRRADVDAAVRVQDQETLDMSRFLLQREGLFLGSSASLNAVAAVRVAQTLGPGHTIVTILCDSGHRHLSKFWNPEVLEREWGLSVSEELSEDLSFLT